MLASALAAEPATITIGVKELASSEGEVECVLWSDPEGFPTDLTKSAAKVRVKPLAGNKAQCVFEAAAGTYAVSMIHDP